MIQELTQLKCIVHTFENFPKAEEFTKICYKLMINQAKWNFQFYDSENFIKLASSFGCST